MTKTVKVTEWKQLNDTQCLIGIFICWGLISIMFMLIHDDFFIGLSYFISLFLLTLIRIPKNVEYKVMKVKK